MTKQILKKASILILFFAIILGIASPLMLYYNQVISDEKEDYQKFLSNTFYNSNLTGPSDLHSINDYIAMSDLYEGIKIRIELVAEASDQAKDLKDQEIVNWINTFVGTKPISISNALELYQFGNAQSINFDSQGGTNTFIFHRTIEKVLSLSYALLDDIDYSTMKAQKFVPIGTDILIEHGLVGERIEERFAFEGIFEGNGFEISNLYLADYAYISTTFFDIYESAAITISTIKHFSMFSLIGEAGIVKNMVLRNPSYELIVLDDSSGLFQFSNFVGENNGLIYNVGVIDKSVNAQGDDVSGINFTMLYQTTQLATAAGFVHTNHGEIYNSYLTGKNIIVPNAMFRFSDVAPFVYEDDGTIETVAFEENAVVKPANNNPGNIPAYDANSLKTGLVDLNESLISDLRQWYYYPQDGYPSLIGLEYVNGEYQINNDFDLMFFSKLINFETVVNGKTFDEHTFVLTKDINMINFKGFKTPKKEFKGILKGGNTDFVIGGTTNTNKYIYNLEIKTPYIVGNKYYLGLFSTLSGQVQNINIYQSGLMIEASDKNYGRTFYLGMIAGELRNGTIKNIINEGTIDLGTEAIGITYVGGLVGIASGTLSFVINKGSINGNMHDFNNKAVNALYYLGGLVGTNSGNITIEYSQNMGLVTAIGTDNDNYTLTDAVKIYLGGIIGEVNNINSQTSKLIYLTNHASLDANLFYGTENIYQYVGGIFGSVKGFGFKLNDGANVYNGSWENAGMIIGQYSNPSTYLYASGIGVANTTENYAKISYISNHAGFAIDGFNYQNHNKNVFYASTIIDNSTGGIELSRAYNYQAYSFGSTYFAKNAALSDPVEIQIAPFFASLNDLPSRLKYVDNYGSLTIGSPITNIEVPVLLKVSNITQSTKVDYYNVTNSGDINVLRINNSGDSIYVAGITWILPYNNKAYVMHNVVNDGNISTAGILGNTVIGTATGMNYSEANYSGTYSSVNNLYIAGLVNLNVGEITNVFNFGKISSSFSGEIDNVNYEINDILGTANSFVGGIVTFNYNLIQDAANSGNIVFTNANPDSRSYFAGVINNANSASELGGININYEGGLTLGGIVSALGTIDATILNGFKDGFITSTTGASMTPLKYAEVLDTINSGDVYGKSKEFVRSAGILGLALSGELASGTYVSKNVSATAGPFGKAILGSADPIGNSLLSNGLNYGNIYAITKSIGELTGTIGTGDARGHANYVRPGINGTAGGVVAYGLTKMIRMINHGTIASTDVAGGVIGATYILGGATTTININTAVHYGKIKVANYVSYSQFTYNENETFVPGNLYYGDNNEIMFPVYTFSGNDLALYPNQKRGFGGFIGRLQRGRNGVMQSANFSNIMNMDEYVDLIGRTDMNSVSISKAYYRLHSNSGSNDMTYYSARPNDTTGYVVVGWFYKKERIFIFKDANVRFTITRTGRTNNYEYYISNIQVLTENTVVEDQNLTKAVINPNGTATSKSIINRKIAVNGVFYTATSREAENYLTNFGLSLGSGSSYDVNTSGSFPQTITKNNYTYTTTTRKSITSGSTSNTPTDTSLKYAVEHIVDDSASLVGKNIFDSSFPLMSEANSKYIYAVEEDALAPRFKTGGSNPKPNGMYVLASTTGSIDGAALPTNLKINNFLELDDTTFKYIDLDNVSIDDKVTDSDFVSKLNGEYINMQQLSYNNKAVVLPEDDALTTKIAELVLYDPRPNGKSPILSRAVINYNTKTIVFNVSNSAFSENAIYYEIKYNLLSQNGIIATDNIAIDDRLALLNDYNNRTNDILPSDSAYKFSYTGSINSGGTVSFDLKVYSELNIMDSSIFEQGTYTDTYRVSITRSSTAISTNATITLDTTTVIANNIAADYSITGSSNTLLPNGRINVALIGTTTAVNNLIPLGHEMAVHKVFLVEGSVETEIDPIFYQIEINPKQSNNYFGFAVTFSDLLQSGNYRIQYSYYEDSAIRSIRVNKRASTSFDVVDIDYNYFSNDLAGLVSDFTRTSASPFTTYIEFGYQLPGVGKTASTLTRNMIEIDKDIYPYTDNKYYQLLLGSEVILTIRIAPFAILNSANIYYTHEGGKVKYIVSYHLTNEATSPKTVTHNILERDLDELMVYLDDNLQASSSFTISREASLSQIGIDFNFIDNILYHDVVFNVLADGSTYAYLSSEIYEGVHSDNFLLYITGLLGKGKKNYVFRLMREEGVYYDLGTLEIEKLAGTSAYLLDIKFTLDDDEVLFAYPIIKASDNYGNPNQNYDPRVYADGIDYGNTIDENVVYFRIDGKVADIILEDYSPRFYLPYGAIIQRYDVKTSTWVSNLYDDFAGGEDGLEKIIKYRVISEDGANTVEYFITASDIKYNLTLRFNIYYELADGSIIDASHANSPVKNSFVLIQLKNLKLDDIYLTTGPTVADFPEGIDENSILGINNQASLYYFTIDDETIVYRFGRNSTGGYNFSIITPLYQGEKMDDLTPGERYYYEMYIMPSGVDDWRTEDYQLPLMSSIADDFSGLYYFVSSTNPNPITRTLAIVIKPQTLDTKWGLYDEYASWDQID